MPEALQYADNGPSVHTETQIDLYFSMSLKAVVRGPVAPERITNSLSPFLALGNRAVTTGPTSDVAQILRAGAHCMYTFTHICSVFLSSPHLHINTPTAGEFSIILRNPVAFLKQEI